MGLTADIATVRALIRRAANELLRVPGAAIPGVLAPTIFFLGLTSVFGNLTQLSGFDTDSYQSFIIPVSMLQGAGFTGAEITTVPPSCMASSWLRSVVICSAFVQACGMAVAAAAAFEPGSASNLRSMPGAITSRS